MPAEGAALASRHAHHRPGCATARCDRHADVLYARHHRPKFHVGLFERCVFNRESGTGTSGPWTLSTIKWSYDDGSHEGAANWLHSTWLAMGGGKYAPTADVATPEQQTLIFRAHATEPGQWDEAVPPCLAYRGRP